MATTSKLLARAMERHRAGEFGRAEAGYREVLGRDRTQLDALRLLSELLHQQGRRREAVEICRQGLATHPDSLHLHSTLANALTEAGQADQALPHHDRCAALAPQLPEVWNNRGVALLRLARNLEAAQSYEQALAADPGNVAALTNLANLRRDQGRSEEAIAALTRALGHNPRSAISWNSLGACLSEQGRVEEAIACFRRALESDRGYVQAHSNLLLNLHYVPHDPAAVFAEHVRFGERWPVVAGPALQWNAERPLRVGYLSADFRRHSVAFFLEPLLSCHDRRRFEVYCYSAVRQPDGITAQFRALAGDRWRDIGALDPAEAEEMIRRDGIDILVDVGGHTAENLLAVVARRPAPIQVNWLGYPNTSGLAGMTHRITDRWADPMGQTEAWHTEELVRLPGGFSCYRPPKSAPPVAALPCLGGAPFTFVSFNNLAKVNPLVLRLWARVLGAVPGSRIVLKARGATGGEARARILAVFASEGIAASRVEFAAMLPDLMEHLASYGQADVALDTFPYHGTTTTCEALWMGVPVVTLAGSSHVSRTGVSLLERAGLGEWIAAGEQEYIEIAARAASNRDALAGLRGELRARMARSQVTDAAGFTAALETAYERMAQGESFAALDWFEEGNRHYQAARGEEAAACYRSALRARDAFPEAWYNLGVALAAADPEGAQACYHRTLELDPRHAGAANNLANLLEKAGHTGRATEFYQRALDADPDRIEPRYNMGVILQNAGRLEEARAAYLAVIERDRKHANAWNNLGGIALSLGQPERAAGFFDSAMAADPEHLDARWNRGLVYLQGGDFERGWPLYETRREQASFPRRSYRQAFWRGEPLDGRRLLVWAEQGLGDAIQFSRFLPLIPGAVFECPERLSALFRTARPGVETAASGEAEVPFDLHIPLMSLPFHLNTRVETLPPPLAFDVDPLDLGGEFKVGVSWQGNLANPTGRLRSMPAAAIARLAGISGVRLFSLQRDEAPPSGVEPLEKAGGSILDTARAIAGLDLVITVDTMIAHLAGSLGRPVWTLLPLAADWRWMSGAATPWYPSMRLWRQARTGDWTSLVAEVRAELERSAR